MPGGRGANARQRVAPPGALPAGEDEATRSSRSLRKAGLPASAEARWWKAQMFESLSDRLSGILDKLTRRGSLTDSDVAEAMREVRRALLEADVALDVVRSFTDK